MNCLAFLSFFTYILIVISADVPEEAPSVEANKLVKDLYNSHEKLRSELNQVRGDIDNTLTILSSIYDILSPRRRSFEESPNEDSYRLYEDNNPREQVNKALESIQKGDQLEYAGRSLIPNMRSLMKFPSANFRSLEEAPSMPMFGNSFGLMKSMFRPQRRAVEFVPQMGARILNTFAQPMNVMTHGMKAIMNN